MAGKKVLFQTELTDLKDSDTEGLAVLREDEKGNVYRWVKNASATALVAAGCCFAKLGQSNASDVNKRVLSPDAATGPATALITVPAGVALTGIAASGAATGDHGWIMVEGYKKVSMMQAATAVQQQAGCCAIMTGVQPATQPWGKCATGVIDSTNGGTVNLRCVQMAASLATTGAATAASGLVRVRCLP